MDKTTWLRVIPESVGTTCGWCGTGVEMTRVGTTGGVVSDLGHGPGGTQTAVLADLFVCPRPDCREPSLVFFKGRYIWSLGTGDMSADRLFQLPRGTARKMEDLPEPIERDRIEAWSCYYGGDIRAAVIMGRAAIQRAARHLKAEGAGLKAEVRDLQSKGVITLELKKWADEVRIAGDDAAHPGELGEIDADEAKESLEFMDEFLQHSVAMPQRRRRREKERQSDLTSP
jgi:hypothetical protein